MTTAGDGAGDPGGAGEAGGADEAPDGLLHDLRVVDLAGEPAAMAGRILADLGAAVVAVSPPDADGHPDAPPTDRFARAAWDVGRWRRHLDEDDPELAGLLAGADLVVDTPGWPGSHQLDPRLAPDAVWVHVTPFGLDGPRSGWRASDLGVHAASGNLFATGDPDRPPVRGTEPVAYAHTGPEVVVAALTALAAGGARRVDVSMQEAVLTANLGAVGRFAREGDRGRRRGAAIGRTREIWPCRDGWVSFGIRGGKARVATWETVVRLARADGIDVTAVEDRDWAAFNHNRAGPDELAALSTVVEQFVGRHTRRELYAWACEYGLTLAPINGPEQLAADEQLASRRFLVRPDEAGDHLPEGLPRAFVRSTDPDGSLAPVGPRAVPAEPWTRRRDGSSPGTPWARPREGSRPHAGPAWAGTTIIEFGAGAAGPVATRYFAEHGATVIRVESRTRPDFLRAYALGPANPHGLEGSAMFDALNPGKRSVTLNLKHPEGNQLARRLVVEHADALAENFAPKGMAGLGLDWASLRDERPDLVFVSACLNGHTGPFRDYPGFGSQGAALSGYTFLTGWPDRAPVGPYGTITDSLAPRFVAAALAAALLHRRRTGRGVYLDLAQVEAAVWSLSPWLLRWATTGETRTRAGNRTDRMVPHGVFPAAGDDRWLAVAVWSDTTWARLAPLLDLDEPALTDLAGRLERVDEIEAALAAWTATREAAAAAAELQALGIEAVPVADFGDCAGDPQLLARGHLVALDHAALGPGTYERNGFRISTAGDEGGDSDDNDDRPREGYDRPSPLLGEDNSWVLGELLGLSSTDQRRLAADGALD